LADKLIVAMVPEPNPSPRAAPDSAADDAFAATVVEEFDNDDGEDSAPPGGALDDRGLASLPTLGHVGRYALKHQLGAGGLGAVYAAIDPLLSRPIAVKTLRVVDIGTDERGALEEQLLAEARAAAGLNHPNIVTVYDAGLADEGVYIAMERLKGRDLRQLIADGWRPDAVQAARIAKRLADALAYAHGAGVVHCDVKPANIFMTGRTEPKLLDFGIARFISSAGAVRFDARGALVDLEDTASSAPATAPPPQLASPYYVSPEHLRGEPLDARADVYGVGVVLYELLTGQRAFAGDSLETLRAAVLEAPVTPAHTVNPKIDGALSAIVARAMARQPGERYKSARHLSRALRQWISEETNGEGHERGARASARNPWVWAAGATVAVALGIAAWLFAAPAREAPAEPAVAAAPADAPTPAEATRALALPPPPTPQAEVTAEAPKPVAVAPAKPRVETVARAKPAAKEAAPAAAPAAVEPPAQGQVQLAVSPWGNVEVNGRSAGTTPPLARLSLPVGTHKIVVRNDDFPAYTALITVTEDKPVTLRHRFGS
jgi:eukaryotic-like serine/threonine-protein kinase